MFKKILPVGIGLVLVVIITLTVSIVRKANDKTPTIKDADKTYVSYGDYNITNDRLYTLMKNEYGLQDLLNTIDKGIYKTELEKFEQDSADKTSEAYKDYKSYLYKELFGNEDLSEVDSEAAQESWDGILSSLRISGLVSKADIDEASEKDYTNESSKAWATVEDFYKLSYVREQWAKEAYITKTKENSKNGELFPMTNKEDDTKSIEKYFEDNYKGNVYGILVPFTSKEAAFKMMNKYGINVDSKVISNQSWIKNTYDHYTKETIEESDKLSYVEVVEAFINMYNEVYAYLNDGAKIIKETDYEVVMNTDLSLQSIVNEITNKLADLSKDTAKVGTELVVPTTAVMKTLDGNKEVNVTWKVNSTDFATLDGNKVVAKFNDTEHDKVTVELNYVVTYEDSEGKQYTAEATKNVEFNATYNEEDLVVNTTTLAIDEVNAFNQVKFSEELLNDESDFNINYSYNEVKGISDSLTSYLTIGGTTIKALDKLTDVNSTYTKSPVEINNYYCLVLRLEDVKQSDLFKKDAEGGNLVIDGKYEITDQELFDKIVEEKTAELLSDNAINEMIYERRNDHKVKIYDAYLEALYEYEYKNFYESTLKLTDYAKYEKTKKNKKDEVATYLSDKDNKKSTVKITANEFFNILEPKYATSTVAKLVENYIIISDEELNSIYNPYTDKVLNKTSYKNLMSSEISTLRKNFESDYFTYSYLTYYGFTPNFPAKYGWKKFIKDYFASYSDQELLTNATYGGSIYSDALTKYIDNITSVEDFKMIIEEMQKAKDKYFSVTTLNLIISIDTNYNYNATASNASEIALEEKDNWTEKQEELAKELGKLMYKLAPMTNLATLEAQMGEMVKLYNEADYDYDEDEFVDALDFNTSVYDYNYFGKFKQAGLFVKFEKAASYDSSSSIYQEYADECNNLYKKAIELGLLDKTMDTPLISDKAIKTDYGYHMIAITSAKDAKELPTVEEIAIHRAQAILDACVTAIETADKNINDYLSKGYDVSSYRAEKAEQETKKAKAEKELKEVLAKYGKAEDYKLDDEAKAKIEAWYTAAEKAVEGGTVVTRSYIKALSDTATNFKNKPESFDARFADFLEILADECTKKENE